MLPVLYLPLLEHSTLVLAAFRRERVESCPTTEDWAAEAGQDKKDGRRQQMRWSHPTLSRAGEQLSPPDLPQVYFKYSAFSPFSLAPRAQVGFLESKNLEPEEILQVQ